jgi:hypothetical protein
VNTWIPCSERPPTHAESPSGIVWYCSPKVPTPTCLSVTWVRRYKSGAWFPIALPPPHPTYKWPEREDETI